MAHFVVLVLFFTLIYNFPLGYVGLGTVSAATWWYLFDEEGPQVSFYQLVSSACFYRLLPIAANLWSLNLQPCFRIEPLFSSPFAHSDTSCSAQRTTRCSRTSTARCLSPATPPPWRCRCWSLSKCSTPSTGQWLSDVEVEQTGAECQGCQIVIKGIRHCYPATQQALWRRDSATVWITTALTALYCFSL